MHFPRYWLRVRLAGLLLATLALLQACGGGDEAPVAYALIPAEYVGSAGSTVDPTVVPAADDTRTYFHVFRSQSEWATWWEGARNRYDPQPLPTPTVDFSSHTVAGVYLGMRSNSCYVLSVTEVVRRGDAIVVRYHEEKPEQGSTCSPFVIYPLILIKIQATDLPIEFAAI